MVLNCHRPLVFLLISGHRYIQGFGSIIGTGPPRRGGGGGLGGHMAHCRGHIAEGNAQC